MSDDRDADLDAVLIGGREPVAITIAPYDDQWPQRFQEWRSVIADVLGERALDIDHIGSTAVAGLAAKPVIDILLTVTDVNDEQAYVPALESAGLLLRVREPGHRMLRTPGREVHVHVYEPHDRAVADYRDFRDWLRISASDRELYADTKRVLAERTWTDMNYYADAKSDVIAAILGRARSWRRGTPG